MKHPKEHIKLEPKDTVDYHIKSTWHSLSRMYNQVASEFGMSQTVGYVLINIEREGTPATKIAPLMGMEPTSLSRLLKNIEEEGLIFRRGDENDKRIVRIFLTDEGLRKKKIALSVIGQFNEIVDKYMKKSELKTFFKVIEKINNLTDEFKIDKEPIIHIVSQHDRERDAKKE